MLRLLLLLCVVVAGCPTSADDDDSVAPRLVDDDDDTTDALGSSTPVTVPGSFESTCAEIEPNDAPIIDGATSTADPPWPDATDCGDIGGSGVILGVTGRVDHLVQESWAGDTDSFRFRFTEDTSPAVTLQWDPLQGDFDAQLWCENGATWVDRAEGGLATSAAPEQIAGSDPIAAGTECYLFVAGFTGPVADYVVWLEAP
jgi:hypothetical protein